MKNPSQIPFSPNTDSKPIEVLFLILHYTATSLKDALNIFQNPSKKVSCHIMIDTDGSFYEVLPCLKGKPLKAFHAGKSSWTDSNKEYHNLNDISLGIELVNLNGNIFPFTPEQYQTLTTVVSKLQSLYPALKNPHHVLGHEHIAGFRGKCDPGHQFDWNNFFKTTYPEWNTSSYPQRPPALPLYLKERFTELTSQLQEKNWSQLNTLLENQLQHHHQTSD